MATDFFCLKTPQSNIWPPVPVADAAQIWSAYLQLDRSQWISREEILENQLRQVRGLLLHCNRTVPYYQQVFEQRGILPDDISNLRAFRKIPLLSRQELQQQKDSLLSTCLPDGTVHTSTAYTSGSSGAPVSIQMTNMVNLWWLAFYLRDLEWCNINPRSTLACIRTASFADPRLAEAFTHGITLPYWNATLNHVIHTGTSHGLDVRASASYQLSWLKKHRPQYILSYPSNLEMLAHEVMEQNVDFPELKAIQSISEALDDKQCIIERAFGVPVMNTYSCVEAGYLASPCPDGNGLHVHDENVLLEVLDDADQPCKPGETGNVFITTLHNFLNPLVRYNTGDTATLGKPSCSCGRGLTLLSKIEGKRRTLLFTADGARKSSSALLSAIIHEVSLRQLQLVQDQINHVEVRIVPAGELTIDQSSKIASIVHGYLGHEINCVIRAVDRLEVPHSGKIQAVIVNEDHIQQQT